MTDTYDFSNGKRGRVVPEPAPEPGKVRITIREAMKTNSAA